MKGTVNNKKGFTLMEVLAVIALIGVLLLFVTPNLVKIFSNSVNSTMKVQEQEIEDAALLYLEDFCRNKLPNHTCPSSIRRNDDKTYSGYITLDTLEIEDYIDEVSLQSVDCGGCIIYTNNKPEAYLTCQNKYTTKTDVDFKSICKIN